VWSGERQTLTAMTEDFSFHLDCAPEKRPVIEGANGVSQKSDGPGHASYYVSFPRLSTRGVIRANGREYQVSGQAWMDHEWFTSELQRNQVGWDWFSVQLDNKTELMIYDFRHKDGSSDPYSSATYIAQDGRPRHLTSKDFSLQPLERWHGYPVAWSIKVPSLKLELECRAKVRNQELKDTHGGTYWEGAVDYTGSQRGVGYLEMTGYGKALRLNY
jgi:predicted secreted hydrolase